MRESKVVKPKVQIGGVNMAIKELVHMILERIKNEPYFQWSDKMGGDLSKRNQSQLHLSPREGAHHKIMQGVYRSFRAAYASRTFEGVHG